MALDNKKGVTLAFNYTVAIILALTMVLLGILFAQNLFKETKQVDLVISKDADRQLRSILEVGDVMAVYPEKMTILRGESSLISVKIYNKNINNSPQTYFVVSTAFDKAYANDGTEICRNKDNESNCFTTGAGCISNLFYGLNPPYDCNTPTFKNASIIQSKFIENGKTSDFVFGFKPDSTVIPGTYYMSVRSAYKLNSTVNTTYSTIKRVLVEIT